MAYMIEDIESEGIFVDSIDCDYVYIDTYVPNIQPKITCLICGRETSVKHEYSQYDFMARHRWWCWLKKLRLKYFGG